MTWRRLRPGELDHEIIWLSVSVTTAVLAWLWFSQALPTPGCPFHHWTGLPCPTCGMTRCLRFTFHHDWRAAATINPLAFVLYGFIVLYDIYAAIVLLFRLPRLCFDSVSARTANIIRVAVISALLGNWAWLIWNRV